MKLMKPAQTVNEIYRFSGVWVKPTMRSEMGMTETQHTKSKKNGSQKEDGKDESERNLKETCLKVKCYGCRKKGRLKNSLLCPENIKKAEKEKKNLGSGEAFMNVTWCEVKRSK